MGAQVQRCLRCLQRPAREPVKEPLSETMPLHTEDRSFVSPQTGIELVQVDVVSSVLERLDKAREAAVDLITREDLDELVDNAEVKVCGKVSERGYFLRAEWHTVVGKDKVMEFFRRAAHRPTWDVNMARSEEVAMGEYRVVYQQYKKVVAVSPRDMVLASKSFTQGQALLEVTMSIDFPDYPPRDNVIRAQVFSGGFWTETTERGLTRVLCVSEMDFGGVIPKSVMLRMSAMNMPAFFKAFSQALVKDAAL